MAAAIFQFIIVAAIMGAVGYYIVKKYGPPKL